MMPSPSTAIGEVSTPITVPVTRPGTGGSDFVGGAGATAPQPASQTVTTVNMRR